MALTQTQIKSMVRTMIRDVAANNRLLAEDDFSDNEIISAVGYAVLRYNLIPPSTVASMSASSLVEDSIMILRDGILAELCQMKTYNQYENQLSYDDGDFNVNLSEKGQIYERLAAMHRTKFEQWALEYKHMVNVSNLLDTMW